MSDDYKSLEHTIRNIQSKIEETTSENKSLEHTIRDIRENFISVGKKTSKFEGLTKNKVYGDRVQPINQHAVQPKKPKDNEALEKAKETISGLAKEESSFADRTTKPIDEKKKKVDEEEPKLHSEMNVNVSGHGQYTGGQFTAAARAHPGHITPHGHSDKGEIAGAYRKRAKERAGLNRVAEETVNEASTADVARIATTMSPAIGKIAQQNLLKVMGPAGAAASMIPLAKQVAPEIAKRYKEQHKSFVQPKEPEVHPETPGVNMKTSMEKMKQMKYAEPSVITPKAPEAPEKQKIETGKAPEIYTPGKQTSPPIQAPSQPSPAPIAQPAKPAAPDIVTGKEKVAAPPAVAQPTTGAATAGATTGVKAPAIADTSAVTAARQAANADTAAQSGAKAQAQSQAQAKTATDTMAEPPPSRGLGLPAFGGAVADSMYHKDYFGRSPTSVGHAKAHKKHGPVKEETYGGVERKKIQNVPRPDAGDRHKIAFVGRKDDDPKTAKEKTSRQAAYKVNVIDEGKKLAGIIKGVMKDTKEKSEGELNGRTIVYPQVIINPDLKHNTMDVDDSRLPNDKK